MFNRIFIFSTLLILLSGIASAQHIETLQQGKRTSMRGLSVVDDSVAWVSGSRGNIGITTNGGKTWAWQQVKGFERADFRGIEAFSDKEAVILSSGTPALILKTTDGGANWQVKYNNTDTTYFLDAMGFDSPKHGIVLGDPIKNKFLLLETNDGAETWHPFKTQPATTTGEAAFAASGTCLRVDKKQINIVSGGPITHLFTADMKSGKWTATELPIAHGAASKGSFSVSADDRIVVGGNYSKDKIADSVACQINGKSGYTPVAKGPTGFQSSVELISNNTYLSTGTSGSNISTDNGNTWTKIDPTSYNVCRKAKKGSLILLAGDGKIGIYK